MKATELFIKALEHEGVEYIFGVPGEENLAFLEALSQSSIKLIVTRHEQAAGFMAATYGRLTGHAGVCLSTLGPGATNLVTATAYAQLGAMPMLLITGQKPIKSSKQGHFQIIDTVSMFKPLTKLSKQLLSGSAIVSAVREAIKTAIEERPGAVHLELPEDVAEEEVGDHLYQSSKVRRPVAEHKSIAHAVEIIQSAKHPLILIGAGGNRKLVSKMLRILIDKTGIPFFDTQMGKGVVDERHDLYLGTSALSAGDYVHCAVEQADLIINIGHDVIEKPPFIMSTDQTVIHINYAPAKIDNVYFPQHEVVGDIANTLWQLSENLQIQNHWDFSYFLQQRSKLFDHLKQDSQADNFPIFPERLVADVRAVMPEDSIVALDNGMYKLWFARYYQAYQPNTLLLDNALATMGAGLPSAITAKLVNPDKKVLAVIGDGGFLMNSQELITAVQQKLDLVIILINDNSFGMIKWKQHTAGLTNFGLDLVNPDFVKLAESYGAHGYRLTQTDQLADLLTKTLSEPGVHLIEVPIDYTRNQEVFDDHLKNLICSV